MPLQLKAKDGVDEVWAAFTDPSNNPSHPGWPLRNLLLLAAKRWGCQSLRVVCVRNTRGRMDAGRSLVLTAQMPKLPEGEHSESVATLRCEQGMQSDAW